MSVLVLDAGNSIIKAKITRRDRGEVDFPQALKSLTETEYKNILSRCKTSGMPTDYLRINGQPFVIGESAERYGVHTQRTGSARYTRDYYGIFAHSFDTAAFDGIVFDISNNFFKVGSSPFFVQIKCRGSKTNQYNAQGYPHKTIVKIAEERNS